MKDERLYAKFTLDFPDHPKILCLSIEAKWALVDLTIYSRRHMTDGFISKAVALAKHGASVCQELATNDAASPSLIEVENGYQIHDFALHQSTKAEIEALTAKRRTAGQKGGQARAKQVLKQTASKINPETETETETKRSSRSDTHVTTQRENDEPKSGPSESATIGAQLVAQANLPDGIPKQTLAKLRVNATNLVCAGSAPAHVLAALRTYGTRTGVTPGLLADLVADEAKRVNGTEFTNHRPATSDLRAAQAQALKNNPPSRLELE